MVEERCDWCKHTNVGPLSQMWEDEVCEGCIALFVQEMAPEGFYCVVCPVCKDFGPEGATPEEAEANALANGFVLVDNEPVCSLCIPARPPVAQCTILKSLLEPGAEYSTGEDVAGGYVFAWGYDSPSNSYFVRCHVCRNPGPSAPSIAEAKAEALKEEFVVFNGELICRICHAGGTTC